MMSSAHELTLPNELPPFSPIVYQPPVKHPFPFETEYSRSPTRIRVVFDELVEKAKEMNLGKPKVPAAKRRARTLGLKVNIDQAKNLHWRSIQARHPVVLTAGPFSPPRTPRRPATDYPTAEQLCLKNMADAQKRQNFAEVYHWSFFAERERAISKWEAEQEAAFRAQHTPNTMDPTDELMGASSSHAFSTGDLQLEKAIPSTASSNATLLGKKPNIFPSTSENMGIGSEDPFQTIIELPVPLMDRSQNLRPEAASSNYMPMSRAQMQSLNIPRGPDPSLWNARLSRSSSIQRHIPAASLRVAPMPLRPKIDHHSSSYSAPQSSRLSFIQSTDALTPIPLQNTVDMFCYSQGPGANVLNNRQPSLTVPSACSDTPDQSFTDDSSLKKRRAEAEHRSSSKIEQRKFR